MGALNNIELKMTECLFCKSKNWKPVSSEVDANEFACFNCCTNYYFILSDSELEKVRSFGKTEVDSILSILNDENIFETRKAGNRSPYEIQLGRLPILFRDLEYLLLNNYVPETD